MTILSRSRSIALAGAAACALSALVVPGTLAAGMYKWTDEKGIIHYSDQMPPDAVNKGTTVFDKQGRPVKKIDAAPTAEQLKAREVEEERLKTTTRERDLQVRKDMALLQSYTSEDEIEFARARAISAVTNQIKAAESYSSDLTRRQQELEKQKAGLNGKPMPAALENELVSLSNELGRQKGLLTQKMDELASINTRYDVDKRRWQDIRNDQARSTAVGLEAPNKAGTKAASSAAK
ncbi:MAG: DUF4124 domain-containing protein [Betaproteobacteria bacterium]